MGKWLLEEFTPTQCAWLRYSSALFSYVCVVSVIRRFQRPHVPWGSFFLIPSRPSDKALLLILGFLSFCFSPLSQMAGLSSSLASENSILVAIEPLMTAFLAWVFLKETIKLYHVLAFSFALVGFGFLTGISPQMLGSDLHPHVVGNLLILFSLLGEASFSILGRKLTFQHAPLAIFGSTLTVGVGLLALAICCFYDFKTLFDLFSLSHLSWKTAIAVFWLGPVGTAGAYFFFMYALSEVPVMNTVLLLFLQPLLGTLWGYAFLGERLTPLQNFGSGLILLAVVISNASQLKKRPIH